MAASKWRLGCLSGLSLVIGPILVLAGFFGRAAQTMYSDSTEPSMLAPNMTIVIGVALILTGIALIVWRVKSTSTEPSDEPTDRT